MMHWSSVRVPQLKIPPPKARKPAPPVDVVVSPMAPARPIAALGGAFLDDHAVEFERALVEDAAAECGLGAGQHAGVARVAARPHPGSSGR